MASLDHPSTDTHPALVAAAARSILSCPDGVNLGVDGVPDVLADQDDLGMQDLDGVPTFSCVPDSLLSHAAGSRRRALLTLDSGLGAAGAPERDAVLTLGGRLVSRGRDDCDCCAQSRIVVELEVDLVLLTRGRHAPGTTPVRVPVDAFQARTHGLNRGFLQRSVEHANACHQDELRRAVSMSSGTRLGDIVGVSLADLLPQQVEVRWVDLDGAHSRLLRFPTRAATTDELGLLLRSELDAGLC